MYSISNLPELCELVGLKIFFYFQMYPTLKELGGELKK